MFWWRRFDQRISKLHERALRIAYSDYSSDFQEVLTDDADKMHQCWNRLAIETYKTSNDLLSDFMKDMLTEVRSTVKVKKDHNWKYDCLKNQITSF